MSASMRVVTIHDLCCFHTKAAAMSEAVDLIVP